MAFSSLFIGATGLVSHGSKMDVIGNNLANVNTTAYKRADARFQNLISQQMATGASPETPINTSQKGMGVRIGSIQTSFLQGSFESSTTNTDIAITGQGFFGLRDASDGNMHYSRAGLFRFDNQGYLLSPQGMRVQGGAVDRDTGAVGSPADVVLPFSTITVAGQEQTTVISPARPTSAVSMNVTLDAAAQNGSRDAANPFFALAQGYNALAESPVSGSAFQSDFTIFDANGDKHTATVSFDPVDSANLSNAAPSNKYWEYIVTIPASEDASGAAGSSAGLVGMGTMTFNQYGEIRSHTAYNLTTGADPSDLNNWVSAGFNADGSPVFDVTFNGAAAQSVALDFGLTTSSASWHPDTSATAAGVGTNVLNVGNLQHAAADAFSSTSYTQGSGTLGLSQDGYAEGALRNIIVDDNGFVVGQFTNNQEEKLFQLSLYRFTSEYGLRREGGNIFSATSDSGAAQAGFARNGGRGSVLGNSLEMSNVDMADQMVDMILTQRGFQSNTKVITTSDSILQTTIQIKR